MLPDQTPVALSRIVVIKGDPKRNSFPQPRAACVAQTPVSCVLQSPASLEFPVSSFPRFFDHSTL
jgi:hypothetical protein